MTSGSFMERLRRMRRSDVAVSVLAVLLATFYAGGKNGSTNNTGGVSAPGRQAEGDGSRPRSLGEGGETNAVLRITGFEPGTGSVSIAFSWATNFMPDKVWLEPYAKLHALTNSWTPLPPVEVAHGATSAVVSVAATNVPAAFYTGRLDVLGIDAPGSLSYERPDGTRLHVSIGSLTVPVAVRRAGRGPAFPPPDAAFAADPFAHVDGLSYDAAHSAVTADAYGSYELPDGGTLLVVKQPKVSFGVPHAYPGRAAVYDASSGGYRPKSPYPLDSRALWRSFRRGDTPTTGCSCVPEVDYGDGLKAVAGDSQGLRSGSGVFPPGVHTRFDYVDGGVWAELLYDTNVVWRGWCSHDQSPEDDGEPDEEDDEGCCDCGDVDSLDGPSLGSVRFRIPLGSPREGEISGFLYVDSDEVFTPGPSSFSVLARADAHVTDATADGVRTVACHDARGRTLVVSSTGGEDDGEVGIQVRDTASGALLHTWLVSADGGAVRFTKVSVRGNVMLDKSYSMASGAWRESDEISGREDRHGASTPGAAGEWAREEDKVILGGVVSRHSLDAYDFVGSGTNAVMRRTLHRELGADGAWTTNSYSYWSDAAHANRHGRVRMASGDSIAWRWRRYDDCGRETFRLDQRDGSPAPADREDYAIGSLPGVARAFAAEFGYEPLPGDSARSNDWGRVRVETRYVVDDGAATAIGRTWTKYEHGFTNLWPVVRTTRIRACRADATMADPGNEVTVEERYDDRSGDVPYTLRGALVLSIDADGVHTIYERSLLNGVVRTVVRRVAGAAEAPVRRVEERDLAYGNLLYEAESPTADASVEFGWRRHSYDEKNRLRSTEYDDGTFETNDYSCCRLLWSQDRSGARRVRYAQTGTDHLYHAWVDAAVADLPRDPQFSYGPWHGPFFGSYAPVAEHRFDGLGRETNVVARTGRLEGDSLLTGAAPDFSFESTVSYPQGVSDVSESVGFRGLRTRRMSLPSQFAEMTVEEECEPNETLPSAVVTNLSVRGGGRVEWRATAGRFAAPKWSCARRFAAYGADGCRVDYDVAESSDCGVVTNSVTVCDFLGRVAWRTTPTSFVSSEYDGASPRVVSTFDSVSGVAVTNIYDECGEQVGTVSGGVASIAETTYEPDASNDWWRVETRVVFADGVTNSCLQARTRLTGLSDARRSEVVELRDCAEVSRTVKSYDASSGTEREAVSSAVGGVSWTDSRLGYPTAAGIPGCVTTNYYAPTGRVYTRWRAFPGGTPFPCEAVMTDALGDEIARSVCDRFWINEGPCSYFFYDCRGNRDCVVDALGNETFAMFDPDGNVEEEGGAAHPVLCAYDTEGRRVAAGTTRDGEYYTDFTQWGYDAATGLRFAKMYADGSLVYYTHTPDGLPQYTVYASGRWSGNAYDARRNLSGVAYSDASLDFSIARDVFGRATNVAAAAGGEWRYAYGRGDAIVHEEMAGGSPSSATAALTRAFDAVSRQTGCALSVDGVAKGGVGYVYGGGDGLLSRVTATNAAGRVFTVEYTNIAGRNCGYALTTPGGSVIRRSVSRDGCRRDLVNSCSMTYNNAVLDSFSYTYDALSRPVTRNTDTFAYNERGEVVSASIGANHFAHTYDYIGNQTIFAANAATNIYTHNGLNQLVWRGVPTAPETTAFSHDLDGNLTNDCVFTYSYDAANRLASVMSNGVVLVANQYDYRNRRTRKTTPTTETTFVYDGWNLIHETVSTITGGTTNTTEIQYFWGMDLSETLQGAGGVGGLLAVSHNNNFYFPAYDNNGNVTKYIDENGNIVAAYEYDDFGRLLSSSGPMADFFRHRFSTKYFDAENGLYYYGERFYAPAPMRWLNRDPIEEDGGLNLYEFCRNNAMSLYDMMGLSCKLGTFNVLRLETWEKPAANGLSTNPNFIKNGEALLSSLGTLGNLTTLSSLSPSALANFQAFVDAVAGKGTTPSADALEGIRRLYEHLKHGPVTIYGELEYELCVCKGSRTVFEKQELIKDNETVLDMSDQLEVIRARSELLKWMINEMYKKKMRK